MEIIHSSVNGSGIRRLTAEELQKVKDTLTSKGLVVYPTETVYGLAADPFDEAAVKKVYMAKKRPFDMPLSIAVSDMEAMESIATLSDSARKLVEEFMPGPLTILVKKDNRVPDIITYSSDTVGIRIPDHPVALQITKAFGPIIATSANKHSHKDAVDIDSAIDDLGDEVDLYVDSGRCLVGEPSTIVLVDGDDVEVIRQGAISRDEIEAALNG